MAYQLPPNVQVGIIDQTSMEGMTPQALAMLDAAAQAAAALGITLQITAARGGGHRSHSQGTEFDLVGIKPDGSRWTQDDRAQIARGAAQGGADRFGLYSGADPFGVSGNGSLHIGLSGPGRPAAVWGFRQQTGGEGSRAFTHPAEVAFLRDYNSGTLGRGGSGTQLAYAPASGGSQPAALQVSERLANGQPPMLLRNGTGLNGSPNDEVRQLQEFLKGQGIDVGPVDGRFGDRTEAAVREFQRQSGITVDGIVGGETRAAMQQSRGGGGPTGFLDSYFGRERPIIEGIFPAVREQREAGSDHPILDAIGANFGGRGGTVSPPPLSNPARQDRQAAGSPYVQEQPRGGIAPPPLKNPGPVIPPIPIAKPAPRESGGAAYTGQMAAQGFRPPDLPPALTEAVQRGTLPPVYQKPPYLNRPQQASQGQSGAAAYLAQMAAQSMKPPMIGGGGTDRMATGGSGSDRLPPKGGAGSDRITQTTVPDFFALNEALFAPARVPPPYLGKGGSPTGGQSGGQQYMAQMAAQAKQPQPYSPFQNAEALFAPPMLAGPKINPVQTSQEQLTHALDFAMGDPGWIDHGYLATKDTVQKPPMMIGFQDLPTTQSGAASHPPAGGMVAPAAGFFPNITGQGSAPPMIVQQQPQQPQVAQTDGLMAYLKFIGAA